MSQARELRVTQHLQIAGTNSSGSSRLASDWRNLLLLVKLPRILSCAPVRLLWDDAARLCWLVLRGGAAAESEAACDSLLALDLSLPPVEIQPLSMAASSSLSPCKKLQEAIHAYAQPLVPRHWLSQPLKKNSMQVELCRRYFVSLRLEFLSWLNSLRSSHTGIDKLHPGDLTFQYAAVSCKFYSSHTALYGVMSSLCAPLLQMSPLHCSLKPLLSH